MKWSRKKSFQVFCVPFIGLTFLVLPLLPSASNHPPTHGYTHAHTDRRTYMQVVIFKHQAKKLETFYM